LLSFFRRTPKDPTKQSIETIAARARRTATEASAYLCTPMGDCEALAAVPHFAPLIEWGIFNPLGPTMCSLVLVPGHGSREQLLLFRVLSPFTTSGIVFGLIPDTLSKDPGRMYRTLEHLFTRNGSDEFPLIPSLPTYFPAIPESPLSMPQVKSLVFLAAQYATDQTSVSTLTDRIERCWCNPWERTRMEFDDALRSVRLESASPMRQSQPTPDEWERWWALVSDKDHVASEVSQMPAAWQGSIGSHRG
jgi:hypothetical protein